jgi:hypothetical protein
MLLWIPLMFGLIRWNSIHPVLLPAGVHFVLVRSPATHRSMPTIYSALINSAGLIYLGPPTIVGEFPAAGRRNHTALYKQKQQEIRMIMLSKHFWIGLPWPWPDVLLVRGSKINVAPSCEWPELQKAIFICGAACKKAILAAALLQIHFTVVGQP